MPCWTPADPTLVNCRNGVGLAEVYGGDITFIVPASSTTSIRPSGRNLIAVGRLNPVASISFRKLLTFETLTVTGADSVVLPLRSRASAVSVWAPLLAVRVSH